MQNIQQLVILEHINEHNFEHRLRQNNKFTTPKINDFNGDLKKRWYVYFYYRNPETGKMQRMNNIYGGVNRLKTKSARYALLKLYMSRLEHFLNLGYDPFGNNDELHSKYLKDEKEEIKTKTTVSSGQSNSESINIEALQPNSEYKREAQSISIEKAFKKAIELKQNVVGKKTLEDYNARLNSLQRWLKKEYKSIVYIHEIQKSHIVKYLNQVLLNSSARNRNNYRTVFSSIFQLLEDNDIIERNFIKSIKQIKSKPKRHKTYSDKEQERIFQHLEENDPILLLFIKFISYNFLRPVEVCRLKVKDINLEEQTLQYTSKTKNLAIKLIPDILFNQLPDLSLLDPNDFLFTPKKIGGKWNASEINRRTNFSKRFKKVKEELGFSEDHTLYSFRHTFITRLYKSIKETKSPFEAKSILMQITGHETMEALVKYLRDINAELPNDYSDYFKLTKNK
ncbi:MAG: hypothetical protein Wins2KO_08290 [Winogradskyella sp.]